MAVKIRLTRMGDKKSPFYRVVVADSRVARDAKYIDLLGTYNPLTTPEEIKIDVNKATDWLNKGAQPTATAKALLTKAGVAKKPVAKKEKASKKAAKKPAAKAEAKTTATKPAAKKSTKSAAKTEE